MTETQPQQDAGGPGASAEAQQRQPPKGAAASGDEPKPENSSAPVEATPAATTTTKPRRRRVVRRSKRAGRGGQHPSDVPDHIAKNPALLEAIRTSLPSDYSFEICKTLHRIETLKSRHVALQLPEGLLMYACSIADVLRRFSPPGLCESVSVLGDVTYGACCVDDLGARALGCDLLVHYGHSCLVPIQETVVKCLYVFVEIRIDVKHAVECFCETCPEGTRVHVMGTVQFRTAVVEAARLLNERGRPAIVPQAKPLSPGEVLGCTAPAGLCDSPFPDAAGYCDKEGSPEQAMLFLADGRFHLEAAMISNPTLRALRYDPYSKTLTDERYETAKMKSIRRKAVDTARSPDARVFGVVLGTLGRQGNPAILGHIRSLLRSRGKRSFVVLLSEIFPNKLAMMPQVDVWVQIACPRLSVDWGHFFRKPLLSAFELTAALGGGNGAESTVWDEDGIYPMDFYRQGSGPWTNYHEGNRGRKIKT
eukprot:CAMPEP_0113527196 /NCGR_PEP_ID=MMETSP0015_2-20120614/1162_1 /TAXON_ID=2838 /ORGANISM="Odontella" /LENGTH=478 /DNA_ID=CAMNT_0000425605 /DNA_START=8 /DNA_END=1444 /DNA_ORIENTATION=- /assembly_acc=CAM_ASM_000160